MPKLIWSVLCESSIIDQQTNNVSLLKVLEQVQYSTNATEKEEVVLPLNFQHISLFQTDEKDNSKYDLLLETVGPDGKTLVAVDANIDFSGKKRGRLILAIQGMKVAGPGIYHYRLSIKKPEGLVLLGQIPLEVQRS